MSKKYRSVDAMMYDLCNSNFFYRQWLRHADGDYFRRRLHLTKKKKLHFWTQKMIDTANKEAEEMYNNINWD